MQFSLLQQNSKPRFSTIFQQSFNINMVNNKWNILAQSVIDWNKSYNFIF